MSREPVLSTTEPERSRRPRRAAMPAELEQFRRRVYRFSDLSGYSLRDRSTIYTADLLLYLLMRSICPTVQWKVRGMENLESIYASGHRAIFTSWHVCTFTATWFWRNRGIAVMSSRSRDAEYTGRLIKRLGYGTIRGSATRGAGRAMAEMAQCLENGIDVGFTIDGPRGPAYIAKPGAITLARHTGQGVLPFHVTPARFIELPSWDRLQIPRPFTRALVSIAEPIYVSYRADAQEKQAELQSVLERLRREGEEWRKNC